MKQLRLFLHSTEETRSSKGSRVIIAENGIKKVNSNTKFFKFSFNLEESISACKKWLMGKINIVSHSAMNSNAGIDASEVNWLRRGTQKEFVCTGSFQEAIGSILVLAQLVGLMPVVGVKCSSASQLRFKWNSIRTMYSFVVFLLLLAYAITTVMVSFESQIHFDRVVPVVFFSSTMYGAVCFGILATKWPRIMKHWESIEAKMPKYRTQDEKEKLARHVKTLSFVVLMCSLLEHGLTTFSTVHYSIYCLRQEYPFKELLRAQLSSFFVYVPYNALTALLGKFTTLVATFSWNYMDLFVMIISYGLSSRFKQINDELERVKGEHMSEDYWAMRRSQYRKLCNLCFIVDDAISQLTFLSVSNNLFFICVQLLRSIRPMRSIPHAIYFWFSLTFLMSRTLAVSLYSSRIHDESKKPINVLRAVPNHSWCIEVRRFCEQAVNDTIALTGMRFFFLTRKLILTVAGTIITYELVLIQFHTDDFKPEVCRNATE